MAQVKYAGLRTEDKAALLEAKETGVKWIVRDYTNELWGYFRRPHKFKVGNGGFLWCLNIDDIEAGAAPLDDETMLFVKCAENPVKVDLALAQIAEMEAAQTPTNPPTCNDALRRNLSGGQTEIQFCPNCGRALRGEDERE